jgi:hypothetical protein
MLIEMRGMNITIDNNHIIQVLASIQGNQASNEIYARRKVAISNMFEKYLRDSTTLTQSIIKYAMCSTK